MGEKLVITTMRNEGPFILEWVAWYRMLGFDHVVILYNDCTDHSPALLQALDDAGIITAVPYTPDPNLPVKSTALPLMHSLPRVQSAEWVFNCDVDEFLVVHAGEGMLDDLIAKFDPSQTHGIAVYWKCFGDGHNLGWEDEFTHQAFTRSAKSKHTVNIFFKTLVRWPMHFGRLGVHSPRGWRGTGQWGEGPNQLWCCDGQVLSAYSPQNNIKHTTSPVVTHDYAQVNHYITRTSESFALKRGTPSTAANKNRYTERFFKDKNRNEVRDESALKYAARFEAAYAEVSSAPNAMMLHHQCCMDYVEALSEVHNRPYLEDVRWEFHKEERDKFDASPTHAD